MFQSPDHYHNLSLRLSEVMDDIGVNERLVMRRRRAWLLSETRFNIIQFLNDENASVFFFGSQSEGSTTLQLKSDIDLLFCLKSISLLQNWSEWKPNKIQCLMVQDETTSPGYCLLKAVRPDIPLPVQGIGSEHLSTDSRGRVLWRHSVCFQDLPVSNGHIRHGPAISRNGDSNHWDTDFVTAFYCSSWPKEAESWRQRQNVSGWPTEDMKSYAVEHGCFVVPVASQANVNEDTEWRISTSMAERCLMFNLNMTQMRCYILMKMIIKTFLKPKCGDTISSFMCKTVLFHCTADTRASEWNDSNLLPCFNQCLQYLLHCILTENCPHFIIPGNNLLAGKLTSRVKQQVVEIMMMLTSNIEQSLLGIDIDQLGYRLQMKSSIILPSRVPSSEHIAGLVMAKNIIFMLGFSRVALSEIMKRNSQDSIVSLHRNLTQIVFKLCHIYSAGSRLEKAACRLHLSPLCAVIGSTIASANIHHSRTVSTEALMWFSVGLDSDFSSSRLKLASALYCAGHYEQCESILVHLKRKLGQITVLTKCICTPCTTDGSQLFERICNVKNDEDVTQQNIAFCVKFLPCEVNCVPEELRYEMFRSTEEDLQYRGEDDFWMDWAVVDSIPFLYFLQYKVNSQLHRDVQQQQQQALYNLARTINTQPNMGHKETALNLLGQCMEEENRKDYALYCYMMSLNVRPRNNAARWHICRLLATLNNHRF